MSPARFPELARANRANAALPERLASLALKQCQLNRRMPVPGRLEPLIVLTARVGDQGLTMCSISMRNQARVHLWYERRFGGNYPALATARDGIDRSLIACTCIEVATSQLYAPDGLEDLAAGMLRINPANPRPDLFRRKAEEYRKRRPWLRIQDPGTEQR